MCFLKIVISVFFLLFKKKLSYLRNFGKARQPAGFAKRVAKLHHLISVLSYESSTPLPHQQEKRKKRKETKPESNAYD